ncbi:MAG TPA: hypothetical protein VIJ06_00770 [Methylovirgula sp.]
MILNYYSGLAEITNGDANDANGGDANDANGDDANDANDVRANWPVRPPAWRQAVPMCFRSRERLDSGQSPDWLARR